MTPYLVDHPGNPHAVDHSLGWTAAHSLEDAAQDVAQLIGADADEIIFTSGATEANNLALLGLGRRAAGGKRRRILVSAIEHKCVLAAGRALGEQHGFAVEAVPVDFEGFIDRQALEDRLGEDILLVSIMAVNNEIGTMQDIRGISSVIREIGALFHCDAAQAPSAMDMSDLAGFVDLLSLSAHKMYGPMGIGALFVQRDVQGRVEPLVYGGGQQRGLRSGTVPVPLCVGMGAAASLAAGKGAEVDRACVRKRRDEFVRQIAALQWDVAVNGPEGTDRHPGNANLRFKGFAAHDILGALQPLVAASTGSACSSGTPDSSHVLNAIGLSTDDVEGSIRFGLGRGTTDADVSEAVAAIDEALSRLAGAGLRRSA